MSFQLHSQGKTRLLHWITHSANTAYPALPENDGVVLPAGRLRHFTEEECRSILQLASTYRTENAITSDGSDKVSYSNRNTLVSTLFPDGQTAWIFDKLEAALAGLMGHFRFDLVGFYEGAQLYRYPTGGFLNPHMDIGKGYMSTRKLGITVQLSNSDSYEGGDLEFIDSVKTAPRELGTTVIFPTYMLHRVTPVTRGERIALVSWVHGPPFR